MNKTLIGEYMETCKTFAVYFLNDSGSSVHLDALKVSSIYIYVILYLWKKTFLDCARLLFSAVLVMEKCAPIGAWKWNFSAL